VLKALLTTAFIVQPGVDFASLPKDDYGCVIVDQHNFQGVVMGGHNNVLVFYYTEDVQTRVSFSN